MLIPVTSLKTVAKLLLILMMGSGDDKGPSQWVLWAPKEPALAPESPFDDDYSLTQLTNGYYQLRCSGLDETVYFSPHQLSEIMSFLNDDEHAHIQCSDDSLSTLAGYILSKNLLYVGTHQMPALDSSSSSSGNTSSSNTGFNWNISIRQRQPDTHAKNMQTKTFATSSHDITRYRQQGNIKRLKYIRHNLQHMQGMWGKSDKLARDVDSLLMEAEKSLIDLGHLSTDQLMADRMLLKNGKITALQDRLQKVTDILNDQGRWSGWRRWAHGGVHNLTVEQYYLQSILNDRITKLIRKVSEGDTSKARKGILKLNRLWSQLDAAAWYSIEQRLGFHPIRIADFIISRRPDSSLITMPHPSEYTHNTDLAFVPVEQRVVQVIENSSNMQVVGTQFNVLADQVFARCSATEFYNPEIESTVYNSIRTISTTTSPHEFIVHVTLVEQILSDIDAKMHNRPTLAQRAPHLLGRALCKFFMGLNPITQTIDGVMSLVHLGQFAATITVGDWYLDPAEYKARMEGYAQTWDALSIENLKKLTDEQWVDVGAQMAANLFYGAGGVSKTLRYLKEIDAIAKTQRQAAQIAQKMIKVIDGVMGKNPLVVTAEGLIMRMHDGMDTTNRATGEIIKNSRALLESSYGKFMQQLEAEITELRPLFEATRKGFGTFANKNIKINYKHILGMDIKFYPNKIDFSGFHHDLMGAIEKSGIVQFTNKVLDKTGIYKADLIVGGKLIKDKTFFPATWSRKDVIGAIIEAYDNFKASGIEAIKHGGKYMVKGVTNQGVEIIMYITENGLITSAYPKFK